MGVVAVRQAVFLDRDGVLNEVVLVNGKPHPPASVEALKLLPGVVEAIATLRREGFCLVVVTNQPDVARGKTPRAAVDAINDHLCRLLRLDAVETCFHDDADGCACRKPLPGLLLQSAARLNIDLSRSYMVGDRWRDIAAGRRANCRSILIGSGYGETFRELPDASCESLWAATEWILSREGKAHAGIG
jgi:D-glycero-D-manno-heptose 1,7-bisphosphate phosphatase